MSSHRLVCNFCDKALFLGGKNSEKSLGEVTVHNLNMKSGCNADDRGLIQSLDGDI